MRLALEAPHVLPSASGPYLPLPSRKHPAPLTPFPASLTDASHDYHFTALISPLFSHSCALLRPQPLCFDIHTNWVGVGYTAAHPKTFALSLSCKRAKFNCLISNGFGTLSQNTGGVPHSPSLPRPTLFPYWHLSKADSAPRIDLAAQKSGSARRTYQ